MIHRCIPLLLFAAALSAQESAVKIRQDKVTFPTYEEGPPDPNPQFAALYRDIFPNYPYTIRTPLNKNPRPMQWRVVILENEYLSCRVLPDLGGHLHGCTDRITGQEIFYSNPVIRRTSESVRGSFIATGIESSFPVAHSRISASPVDFAWSVRDGVGRVIVEDTDRTSGMQWRDEFILRPGLAVLEQRVTLYNGSAARRGYHWWANAAVELDDPHLRIVYPVKWMLPHGDGPMTSWPIGENGVDLSDVANRKSVLGLFAHASREPWMAIYKPAFRRGVAHYADPDQVKGKKIWLWGTDDKYVKQNLTENFNSYVEMQAGVFETQPEFAFLLPEESKMFTHYWIPFRDLGGISRATPDAVLNLSRSGQTVTVELNATHGMKGAKIRLLDGAKPISETQADLDPKVKFAKTLEAAPPLTVDIVAATGRVVLHHVEGEYNSLPFDKTARNPEPVEPVDKSYSEKAILERGAYYEQRDQWPLAWQDYEAGLEAAPNSPALSLAAGRAAVALNRYGDAVRLLRPIAKSGAEAAYYYGVALGSTNYEAAPGSGSQQIEAAQASLFEAARDPSYAAAAQLQLALLGAREFKGPQLAQPARMLQALAGAPFAPARLGALEIAMLRRTGNAEEAKKQLDLWLRQDPANDMLRVEQWLLSNVEDDSLWNHLAADPERVLDAAEQYRQIGAWDDALKLLDRRYPAVPPTETEPGTVLPQENALLVYYRGYCRLAIGQDPMPDFKLAGTLSALYAFPHREIGFRIFRAALAQNDSDALAHSLLGNLYFDSMQTHQALAEWRKALTLKHDLPALHRNLGRALLDVEGDPAAAAPVLSEGRRLDPADREIADALTRLNTAKPMRPKITRPAPGDAVTQKFGGIDVAKGDVAGSALVHSAIDPDAAAAQFNAANFPKDKQPDAVRRAYIEVQLQRLLARAYAGRCSEAVPALETLGDEDASLPFTLYGFGAYMKSAHFQYYMGKVESVCGAEKAAKKRWSRLSRTTEPVDSVDYIFPYLAARNLGENDAQPKIDAALQALRKVSPKDSPPALAFAQGALLMAAGRSGEGDALLQKSLHAADPFMQYLSLEILMEASRK